MEDKSKRAAPPPKKPYQKPELKQIPLRPEEAVLGACKTTGVSGPATSNCGTFMCSAVGS